MRSDKTPLVLFGIIVAIILLITYRGCSTHRHEPCTITSMYWWSECTIERSSEETSMVRDTDGNMHWETRTVWRDVKNARESGNKGSPFCWPKIRIPGHKERLKKDSGYSIQSKSKIDNKYYTHKSSWRTDWDKYSVGDEILVSVSFTDTVWSIKPYKLE